ncbi:YwqG family protein [Solirubrobacter ginsenosidimutans]|uniref:YwqG family protein n=1 Tax=Solirubrobacter ginsenosidimutans TaxID=490573 RepID=A0A9X3S535_9ACTN|nr:DUF1963 domain-containing protein [Solirubrobacter ginsenosidimutans]MDA0161218.1 YwqG family protein [Solirubrobacter ginsenosidimutans]
MTAALPRGDGGQWVGGHMTGAQGVVDETGTLLLFSIEDDDDLGFEFADAGVIQFRIAEDALAAGDWSQIVAVADSC